MDVLPSLVEFPADDPERARRFWSGLLGVTLDERPEAEGSGWQTHTGATSVGVHARGAGPGDTVSLPYFTVPDMGAALEQVQALGGSVIHPGVQWAILSGFRGKPVRAGLSELALASGAGEATPRPAAARSRPVWCGTGWRLPGGMRVEAVVNPQLAGEFRDVAMLFG